MCSVCYNNDNTNSSISRWGTYGDGVYSKISSAKGWDDLVLVKAFLDAQTILNFVDIYMHMHIHKHKRYMFISGFVCVYRRS